MPWFGLDRRRGPRRGYEPERKSEPTYLVERDAPPGPPMDPTARWFRRFRARSEPTYDNYPDHEVPWHVLGPPGPVVPVRPIRDRLPKARSHPVALYVKRYGRLREVKLGGYPLEMAVRNINRRSMAGWIVSEIADTLAAMEEEEVDLERSEGDDNARGGQGLAEYALILALIAIVAIIAVLFLGAQVSNLLFQAGNCIPDGC